MAYFKSKLYIFIKVTSQLVLFPKAPDTDYRLCKFFDS